MRHFIMALSFALASSAEASVITFATAPGSSVGAGSVAASATFTTSNGTLVVMLSDLLPNPTSIGQAVSDLIFLFTPAVPGNTTLGSSSGQEVSISNGTPTFGSVVDTGWGFGAYNSGYILCVICPNGINPPYHTAPPSHLIIGPGPYSNANSSIDGHSPSLYQTATFTLTNPNITSETSITGVTFSFGTSFGEGEVAGAVTDPQADAVVPEPGAWLMIVGGIGLLCLMRARARPDA